MLYYKITSARNEVKSKRGSKERDRLEEKMRTQTQAINDDSIPAHVCIAHIGNDMLECAALAKEYVVTKDMLISLFHKLSETCGFGVHEATITEITLREYSRILAEADGNDYIKNDDVILDRFGLGWYGSYHHRMNTREVILDQTKLLVDAIRPTVRVSSNALIDEIKRIEKGRSYELHYGHPVHYIICADDDESADYLTRQLVSSLVENDRILSRRMFVIDCKSGNNTSLIEKQYCISGGGAVQIKYLPDNINIGEYSLCKNEMLEIALEVVKSHAHDVLTILRLPSVLGDAEDKLEDALQSMTFVKISEDAVDYEGAKNYLKLRAGDLGIKTDRNLYASLNKNEAYKSAELNKIFDAWFSKRLKTSIYPQYADLSAYMVSPDAVKGNAFKDFEALIGLSSSKELIKEIIDFASAQKLYPVKGGKPSLHMMFAGNPGTAKTTVARLVAKILKENQVLENGELIEVGRSDLVGKYVGHTAPRVKAAFRRAKGSVLFIDEAYSLVDDRDGLFGDEAINTIVQEMENHRDDTIVIFAGYPDKMEGFLNKNPGLRSRIGFHVDFPDYNAEELCNILEHVAGQSSLLLADDVREKVMPIFEKASTISEFGNGRYARNMLEKAKIKRASRLIRMNPEDVTEKISQTLIADDFEDLSVGRKDSQRVIGFAV
ncbi:MAG: AAA family ATPase [Clostridiales Family XIII bacterium]|jgi:AAA+ superfamily predicted ATPase|nr:AAA family ATPase [Clostridiales Family XIII bacterium]